ncbi:tetratricopeptide (TPR) repeat protein [Lipingzhangella halophila]|uniref:Tetratricopeptide (TPR) repeat protein n=1 Tax=Lipingzhangella halophila TaxID=1783352 RepID=A0A7W7RDM2_9ACTN|nr:hypothetical protein [Lipingzhangella halophila]MBB4930067.1 tetratricopeptide (TPR) repeat protein [Lipingzhangella halophila]
MLLTSICVWLQATPDLFGDDLPRVLLLWLTALGAFGQAIAAIVYPELARRFNRPQKLIEQPQPGNDLPPPLEHFVGYEDERARIDRLFARFPRPGWKRLLHAASWRDDDNMHPALVVVITGPPGTGKSQLANRIARKYLDRFPDGVRRIDLLGDRADFDETHLDLEEGESEDDTGTGGAEQGGRRLWNPISWIGGGSGSGSGSTDGTTADPELSSGPAAPLGRHAPRNTYSLLEEALDAIGDPPSGPRRHLEQTWRRQTDGRRLLLVLENAADPEQIRALIPNSALSAVIVTSRRSFVSPRSFADADFGWETVELFGFSENEVGVELLDQLAPVAGTPDEVEAERELRRRIAALCHGLPIALGMCGKRLAAPTGDGARELLTTLRRVDQSPLVQAPLGFRASFTAAFQQCTPLGRLLLRRMAVTGVYQIADFSAAALLDLPCHEAQEVIDDLETRFLVEQLGKADDGRIRYQLHQLAADMLRVRDPEDFELPSDEALAWSMESSLAARERLVYAYTWLAEQAAEALSHTGDQFGAVPAAPPELIERLGLTAPQYPQAWLERDREFLLGCVWVAGADGRPDLGRRLARAFAAMCQTVRTHWDEWGEAVRAQRQLAEVGGDPHALAMAMLDESEFAGSRGDYDLGVTLAEAARDAFEEQGAHPRWRARALRALGGNQRRRGDVDAARVALERAENIFAAHGETWWQARTRCNLAEVDTHVGTYDDAQHLLKQARDAFDAEGDSDQGQHTRILLAEVLTRLGCDLEAWNLLQEVRKSARAEGKDGYVARCLRALGALNHRTLENQYTDLAKQGEQPKDAGPHVPGAATWHKERVRRRSWSYRSRMAMFHESIELLDRMGDHWGMHWTRLTMGLTQIRDGFFKEGDHQLKLATEGFATLTDKLWRARSHRIIAERLLTAAMPDARAVEGSMARKAIGVGAPTFRKPITTAYDHAQRAIAAYAEIPDRSGQIRAQMLLARIMRAEARAVEEVDVPLRTAERLAWRHGMRHLAEEATELRRMLSGNAQDHATVAEYWPIS